MDKKTKNHTTPTVKDLPDGSTFFKDCCCGDNNGCTAEVRITKSDDMGLFMHIKRDDGTKAGICLGGTVLESWAMSHVLKSRSDYQTVEIEATESKVNMRMDAYYYGFERTGVYAIDKILSAVACAGKAFHDTSQWVENGLIGASSGHKGDTPEEWIQNAANEAARKIKI